MKKVFVFIFVLSLIFIVACDESTKESIQQPQEANMEEGISLNEDTEEESEESDSTESENSSSYTETIAFDDIELNDPVLFDIPELNGTGAMLKGATDKHLVFLTSFNDLVIYNMEKEKTSIISDKVQYAIVSDDAKFVFYVREEGAYDIIHYYDIELGVNRGSIYPENFLGGIIRSMVYTNGIVYHTYGLIDPYAPHRYESVPVKMVGHTDVVLEVEDEKLIETSNALAANNNNFYYYSIENESINRVNLQGPNEEIAEIDYTFNSPDLMVVNDDEAWAIRDKVNNEGDYDIVTSFGVINNRFSVRSMDWIYDDYLLFTEGGLDDKLFIVNPETMEERELAVGISAFTIFGDTLYGEMSSGTMIVYKLHK